MANFIVGPLRSIRFSKPEQDGSNSVFLIAELESRDIVKGTFEVGEIKPGITYKWYGSWTQGNGKYPPSFAVQVAIPDTPHSREAIVEYLSRTLRGQNVGIGPATAQMLFDAYGSEAVRELRTHPAEVAKRLKLDPDKMRTAAMILEREAKSESVKIELFELFKGQGFSKLTIKACIDRWKSRAAAIIKRDAFSLLVAKIPGAGFLRCDKLYLDLGGDPKSLKRQMLCAWWAIRENGDSTWHPVRLAIDAIRQKVGSVETDPQRAIRLGIRGKWLTTTHADPAAPDKDARHDLIAIGRHAENERAIARHIHRLNSFAPAFPWSLVDEFDSTMGGAITDHQAENLARAASHSVGVLAGTPGTGKTHTAASWLRALLATKQIEPGKIAVVAPTGKAAVRITEAMARYDLPIQACTIHRLLLPDKAGHGDGEWAFGHDENNPLDFSLIVVDESSMIETDLMAALLRACADRTQILFLGDPFQLPPVGHGAPLRDLIDASMATKTPFGLLEEVQRNDGLIVQNCAGIKDGKMPQSAPKFSGPENCRIVACASSASIMDELSKMYAAVIARGSLDPIEDIQVLVSLNEKSDLGRSKLNKLVQDILNQSDPCPAHPKFRVGDKIICLKNGRYPSTNGGTVDVMNGELGRVVDDKVEGCTILEFPDTGETTGDELSEVLDDYERADRPRIVRLPKAGDWSAAFDLGYAITVHKSQGSEWPIVVIIGDNAADRVASREWWYTAISRAKSKCLIFAARSTIARQIKRVTLHDRKTLLVEYLDGRREIDGLFFALYFGLATTGKDSAKCSPPSKTTTVASSWSEPIPHEIETASPIL